MRIQKRLQRALLIFLLAGGATVAMAQTSKVSGIVKDSSGEPIVGATVVQKGTQNYAITNASGQFSIDVPKGSSLTISFLGFTDQEVKAGNNLNIIMKDDAQSLQDVVVIGYGTVKRSDISGSVASVDTKTMLKKSPINVNQMLQGAVPGVMVTTDGAPSGSATVRIRGIATINNGAEPLYVVDGVQVGSNANFLNPQDIQSMEVLKDASATAIYGARGANGVILITTKQGQKGKTNVDVTAEWGLQNVSSTLNTLGVEDFARMIREGRTNDGSVTDGQVVLTMPVWGTAYDGQRKYIDWQKELTQTALRQNYAVSVNGGTQKQQGTFSANYLDNEGTVINSIYRKATLRSSLKAQVNDYLEIGGELNFQHINYRGLSANMRNYATLTPSMDYTDDNGSIVHPNVVNADGTYGTFHQMSGYSEIGQAGDNPYAQRMESDSPTRQNIFHGNVFANINIVKGLTAKVIMSYSNTSTDGYAWSPTIHRYNNGESYPLVGQTTYNSLSLSQSSWYDKEIEDYLTYHWSNDTHDITAMIGNSVSQDGGRWVSSSANQFAGENIRDISMTTDLTSVTGSGAFNLQTRFISYYGRLMYGLLNRYNVTATIRRDGSSNFGSGNRWGTFPSFAASWRITEEPFMKNVKWLSHAKLRLGWGQTGNSGYATNSAIPQLSNANTMYHFYANGADTQTPTVANGLAQQKIVDTNLKWETNEQTNIGLDLGFLNSELTITLDYFVRNTKDLLLSKYVRPSTGYNTIYTNFGEIQNKGLEFSIGYNKQINPDWHISATLTGSTIKNKVVTCGDPIYATYSDLINTGYYWNNHSVSQEGSPIGSFYGYLSDGLFTSQEELDALNAKAKEAGHSDGYQMKGTSVGDIKYKDINGDGYISDEDRTVFGDGFADLNYGLNISVNYKNWDASVYTYGVLGQDILSASAMKLSVISSSSKAIPNILESSFADAFRNGTGTLPRLSIDDPNHNSRVSDFWVRNGDYFKISNVQIGYTFDNSLLEPLKIKGARVYVAASNLLCISPYNKYGDPELSNGILYSGFDMGRYPQPRTFSFGLNVTF